MKRLAFLALAASWLGTAAAARAADPVALADLSWFAGRWGFRRAPK